MIFLSVHAPFEKAARMWGNDTKAKQAVEELVRCVKDCAEVNVPILVVHPYIGFEEKTNPTEGGVENFRILTFELNKLSKPNRHENDKYTNITIKEYVSECYIRACKVAYMKNGI